MNQELYDKTYKLPNNVLKAVNTAYVSNPTGEGVIRAKNLLKDKVVSYSELKKLKHLFDKNKLTSQKYVYAGGDAMKHFIEDTLNSERNAVKKSKERREDMTVDPNLGTKAYQGMPDLNESKTDLKKNAVAVIMDNNNKILLLKRADNPDIWQPNKWSLVGGGIEKGERPEQACKREVKEETDLDIDKFVKSYTIQRSPDSIEYIFAARYDGDPTDIELDTSENTNYGWYDIEEMNFLETVPNLVEYILLVFKKYDE